MAGQDTNHVLSCLTASRVCEYKPVCKEVFTCPWHGSTDLRGLCIHGPATEETGIHRSGTEQMECTRMEAVGAVSVHADLPGSCSCLLQVCVLPTGILTQSG